MVICTFYSHEFGTDKILTALQQLFPQADIKQAMDEEFAIIEVTIKGGLFRAGKKIKIAYRQRNALAYQLPQIDDSPLTANIKGLYGYVSSLPAKNEHVRNLFLRKIETVNSEFSLQEEQGEVKELKQLIEKLALDYDAVLFVQPRTVISKSNTQHFLDKHLNLILDGNGNCEIDSLSVVIDTALYDAPQATITDEQKARKERSEIIVSAKGIKVNQYLPCVEAEEETTLRSVDEIAQRVCIMSIISEFVFNNITADDAIDYLKAYDLWKYLTPKEEALLLTPTDAAKQHETWKCECIWTLLWALKKVDNLGFPDDMCSLQNIPRGEYPIGENKDPNDFINAKHTVRSKTEILDMADLYYRLDWACVDARLNGNTMTAVHPGVVYERHYALNWLVGYMGQEWDEVTCDT